jgi:hypothetical protein
MLTHTKIQTEFYYPDGDRIYLYYSKDPDGTMTVSDLGETHRWVKTLQKTFIPPTNVDYANGILSVRGCDAFQLMLSLLDTILDITRRAYEQG